MKRKAFAIFALLAACGAPTVEAPPPVPPAATTAIEPPAPTVAPTTTAEAPPEPPPKSDFSVVARFPGKHRLGFFGVDGALFLDAEGRQFPIENGLVVRDDAILKDLAASGFPRVIVSLSGRYPDMLFATLTEAWGRTGFGRVMRREHGAWKEAKQLPVGSMFVDVQRWDHDRLVGVFVRGTFDRSSEVVVVDGQHGVVPKLSPAPAACKESRYHTEVLADAFLAFPSGHLYVAGQNCDQKRKSVEIFEPGKARGTIVTVPLEGCGGYDFFTMAGLRPDDVYFSARCASSLVHFDGKTFSKLPSPEPAGTVMMAPDGAVFVKGKALHRRGADGAWTELRLPSGTLEAVRVVSATDVWATTESTLLHTGPPPASVQEITLPEGRAQIAADSLRVLRGATEGCESTYVLLFAFVRTTPDDYDFPLTRKALKGHAEITDKARFVVTRDGGKKYFGAFVSDVATARKLAALVQKEVKDSAPQVLCVKPEELREIKIDPATGDVVR